MTCLQSYPGIVPERFFEMIKSHYRIRDFRAAAPAPEAGALPGCATLRWLERRYHIGILDAQALFRAANKSEQNEHEGKSVPDKFRSVRSCSRNCVHCTAPGMRRCFRPGYS